VKRLTDCTRWAISARPQLNQIDLEAAGRAFHLKIESWEAITPIRLTKWTKHSNIQEYTAVDVVIIEYMYILHTGNSQTSHNIDCFLGFLCYIRTVFHLNCFTAQPPYAGKAAVEGGKYSSISKYDHHNIMVALSTIHDVTGRRLVSSIYSWDIYVLVHSSQCTFCLGLQMFAVYFQKCYTALQFSMFKKP
jgi:hypothetical protein